MGGTGVHPGWVVEDGTGQNRSQKEPGMTGRKLMVSGRCYLKFDQSIDWVCWESMAMILGLYQHTSQRSHVLSQLLNFILKVERPLPPHPPRAPHGPPAAYYVCSWRPWCFLLAQPLEKWNSNAAAMTSSLDATSTQDASRRANCVARFLAATAMISKTQISTEVFFSCVNHLKNIKQMKDFPVPDLMFPRVFSLIWSR